MARPQRHMRDGGLLLRRRAHGAELMMRSRGRGSRPARLVDVVQAMVCDDVRAAVRAWAAMAAFMVLDDRGSAGLPGQLGRAEGRDLVAMHAHARAMLVGHHARGTALAALAVRAVGAAQVLGCLLVLCAWAGALAARGNALGRGVVDRIAVVLGRAHVRGPLTFTTGGGMGVLHAVVEGFGFGVQVGFRDGAGVRLRGLVPCSAIVHDFADIAQEGALEVVRISGGGTLGIEGE